MSHELQLLLAIVLLALGTYLMRASGPLLHRGTQQNEDTQAGLDRATIVLLIAVSLTSALFDGQELVGPARPIGVAAAVAAALLRAPVILVLVLAMLVTAVLRLLGVP